MPPYLPGQSPCTSSPEPQPSRPAEPLTELSQPLQPAIPPTLTLPISELFPPSPTTPASPHPHRNSAGSGMFYRAQNFTITNSRFVCNSGSIPGLGLDKLLENSMPDAFHDSAARHPPPKCHLGTRNEYITKITDWVVGKSDHHEPILWMCGPFGIGKTAVAQSCAEALKLQNRLAATVFFSRSNTGRDDPLRVVTSIAYQIATISPSFRDIIDTRVCDDPALTTKSLMTQFEELLVYPLGRMAATTDEMEGRVVIIDGLDECRGIPEQCGIIEIIAASARNRTTPFRWFITSRPEDPIIQTMKSETILPVIFHLELPVSRSIDHEILIYLTDEFEKIRKRHRLPDSWPSEEALALLVERTAGLWIYVKSIVRFITDENSFGPEDQLQIVLRFVNDVSMKVGPNNPLAEMDSFYALIMQQVPLKIRTTVRKILLLQSSGWLPDQIPNILSLSEEQFRHCCASIQSVLEVQESKRKSKSFHYYHASFLDFMKDPKRSKELSIYGDFLIEYRKELLDWLHEVCSRSTDLSDITFPSNSILNEGCDRELYYFLQLNSFWDLCNVVEHPFDLQTAVSLSKLRFRTMLRLVSPNTWCTWTFDLRYIMDNIPVELRDKIIRRDKCPTPGCTNTENVCILGYGKNEAFAQYTYPGHLWMVNNQDPPNGKCPCGSSIMRRRRRNKRTMRGP